MTRLPPTLKWLAEKRARLAYDVRQTEALLAELTERHEKVRAQLAAVDATLQIYDSAIDPTHIEPLAAWRGRYGKRGVLRDALVQILVQLGPDWVVSSTLELALIARFGIAFESPAHRKRWHQRSFCNALLRLAQDGTAERLHDPNERTGKHGYWRLRRPEVPSLADL